MLRRVDLMGDPPHARRPHLGLVTTKPSYFASRVHSAVPILQVRLVSQPLLAPLDHLANFHILAKVTSADPSHSAMLMVSSSHSGPYSS